MSQYKISIIVPIFNGEKYLERAIKSIINQSFGFENIELILIDDCSKDNSKEIILKYANQYSNIIPILLEKNSGCAGKPRNLGLLKSTAPFLMFLDVDDYYLPKACETLYDAIVNENTDIVLANYYLNSNGNIMKNNMCPQKYDKLVSIDPLANQEYFELITNMTCMAPWSKIFDGEFIRKNHVQFSVNTQFDDAQFYFEALMHAKSLTVLPKSCLYCYNEYDDSIMHKHDRKLFNSFFHGFKEINKMLDENPRISNKGFLNEHLQSLLLIFSNTKVPKNERIEMMEEIYEFEKQYDYIEINSKEISILNNAIMNRKFSKAIRIANVYSFLYNNQFIKGIYRKYNNSKRKG